MIWRHPSHFTQSPSVFTFFSPEVSRSCDCRLNQLINAVLSSQSRYAVGTATGDPALTPGDALVLDAALRQNAFLVGVLYFAHLGDGIRQINNCRVRVASRQG